MKIEALLVARGLVVVALFPVLAGCAGPGEEPLQRADVGSPAPAAPAERAWAPIEDALVRPGITIRTEARDCPSSFLFVRPDNGAVFVATTAYCVRDLPIGAPALVGGDTDLAVLVYSSWQTMAEVGEADPGAHEYNDFALFHLDSVTAAKANPTLVGVAGPAGVAPGDEAQLGDRVRSLARDGTLPVQSGWRDGLVTGRVETWALLAHHVLPGAPGALGGAVVDDEGRAVGVLVNLGVVPNPGSNGVARLDALLAYANGPGRMGVELATAPTPSPES